MTALAHDAATPWTSLAGMNKSRLKAAKEAGAVAVTFYIVGSPGGMRCATRTDVNAARKLGLGVLPNWERAADWARTASITDANRAGAEALYACRALGIPAGTAVAFSFDYEIPPWDFARCAALLAACAAGMGGQYQAIAYGQSAFLAYLAQHGQPGPHWLMMSTFGLPEYDVAARHVGLVQAHDAHGNWLDSTVPGTDVNTVTHPETLRAWWPTGSRYGTDTLPEGDPLMAPTLSKEVQDEIAAIVAQQINAAFLVYTQLFNGESKQPGYRGHQFATILQHHLALSDATVEKVVDDHTDAQTGKLAHSPEFGGDALRAELDSVKADLASLRASLTAPAATAPATPAPVIPATPPVTPGASA